MKADHNQQGRGSAMIQVLSFNSYQFAHIYLIVLCIVLIEGFAHV